MTARRESMLHATSTPVRRAISRSFFRDRSTASGRRKFPMSCLTSRAPREARWLANLRKYSARVKTARSPPCLPRQVQSNRYVVEVNLDHSPALLPPRIIFPLRLNPCPSANRREMEARTHRYPPSQTGRSPFLPPPRPCPIRRRLLRT